MSESILSEQIHRLRKQRKMTQEELSGQLGITPQSVSRWENGQSRPDVDMLPKLAAIFEVSVDSLFGYHAENLRITQYEDRHKRCGYYQGTAIRRIAREILALMPPKKPINVLEIGCGEGQTSIFFARNGYVVSGFDLSEKFLEQGRQAAKELGVEVNFFRADILTYKMDTNFDIIYSSGVMQCVPPEERVRIFTMIKDHTNIGGLNVINAFVEKDFISPKSGLLKGEYFYRTAELFSYYDQNWKFEEIDEMYFDYEQMGVPQKYCMDVLIARKKL